MTDVKMPEPQATANIGNGAYSVVGFTEAQMKQYGDDRAREAIKMAVQTVLNFQAGWIPDGFTECADAIRALAKEIK